MAGDDGLLDAIEADAAMVDDVGPLEEARRALEELKMKRVDPLPPGTRGAGGVA